MARSATNRVGRPRRSPRRDRRALHLVVSLAVTLSTLLVAIIAIGQATGAWRLAPVLSGSMEPNVPKGAMVVAEQVDIHHLRVGDIMLFNAPLDGHPPVVHRIHEIFEIGGEPAFRTKGDANDAPDAWTIHLHARKVWRVAHVIPYAGTLVGLLHQADLRVLVLVIGIGTMTMTGLFAIWHDTGSRRADEGADEGDGASPGSDPTTCVAGGPSAAARAPRGPLGDVRRDHPRRRARGCGARAVHERADQARARLRHRAR